jgi:thiamine biosynthesis lipoprotein
VVRCEDFHLARFQAMASPCEILLDTGDAAAAAALAQVAEAEVRRVETKFSRYRTDNLVHEINHAAGRAIAVDAETAGLLDYAALCFELSGGCFDITSGALRRVWKFDGGVRVPDARAIADVLRHVGWSKVEWRDARLRMPAGMEIDFGGIGKEYAADRAATLVAARTEAAVLVNLGGDLFATGPRRGGRPWGVGVDDPDRTGEGVLYRVELARGGLATSGDARRFVLHGGKRLGHILDARTGWPVEDAPRSVTVVAATCLEAGTLSTLASMRGLGAEEFLTTQGVEHRIVR